MGGTAQITDLRRQKRMAFVGLFKFLEGQWIHRTDALQLLAELAELLVELRFITTHRGIAFAEHVEIIPLTGHPLKEHIEAITGPLQVQGGTTRFALGVTQVLEQGLLGFFLGGELLFECR